jgi:acetyl esterase/lipase
LVACEYRRSGEATWPAQIHDVKAALRWMRANAGRLNIDPTKIAVSGNSAGAHLSLMLAGTRHVAEFEGEGGNPGVSTAVAAAIAFYGPAQIWGLEHRRREVNVQGYDAVGLLMGVAEGAAIDEARLRAASPLTYAAPGHPPTLLIHGNKDALVPHEASRRMHTALEAAKVPAELHIYDGAPHAFDALPDFGRQCASIMALFLDRHVVRPRAVTVEQVAAARR